MTLLEAQTEPPGDPRETPWPDESTKGEPGGEPRETPWPQSDDEDDD